MGVISLFVLFYVVFTVKFKGRPRRTDDATTLPQREATEPQRSSPVGDATTSSEAVNAVAGRARAGLAGPFEAQWKVRFRALAGLVKLGPDAAPAVAELLRDGSPDIRALSAAELARLYAAMALGRLGAMSATPEIERIMGIDSYYDVRTHVEFALARRGHPLDAEARQTLASLDLDRIDSARIDAPAPDFRLADIRGRSHTLSDLRGQKPVLLLFLAGDT